MDQDTVFSLGAVEFNLCITQLEGCDFLWRSTCGSENFFLRDLHIPQTLKKDRRVLKLKSLSFFYNICMCSLTFTVRQQNGVSDCSLHPQQSPSASRDNHSPFCVLFVILGMIDSDKKEMVLQIRDVG